MTGHMAEQVKPSTNVQTYGRTRQCHIVMLFNYRPAQGGVDIIRLIRTLLC